MSLRLFSRNKHRDTKVQQDAGTDVILAPPAKPPQRDTPIDFQQASPFAYSDDPLRKLLEQKRFQVVLQNRDQFADHPEANRLLEQAIQELEHRLAMVPAGVAVLPLALLDQPGCAEEEIEIEPFLLAVHTVTNEEFQHFVDDGGYEALEYWPEDIWPHLIEFKDLTDCPGPSQWREGRHDKRFADHPVVGVSWFESQAYALWANLRLPTEPEWHVAASWSIKSSANIHRRFPWGDAMDNERCNIWSTRFGRTVPVDMYANGAAPNKVLQLVGNVWEWTAGEFAVADEMGSPILGEMIMQTIRGGAYDTIFETQATSQFRSGLIALARTHNTGFRCALDFNQATWMNDE